MVEVVEALWIHDPVDVVRGGGMEPLAVDRDDKIVSGSGEEASGRVFRVEWGDPFPFDP